MEIGQRACALVLALVCLSPGAVHATAVIDINFEGDTTGAMPATSTTVGDPMTVPSAIGGFTYPTQPDPGDVPPTAASGTVVVGNPSGGSKEAVFTTNSNNAQLGALYMDVNGFNLAAQQVQMSFNVNVLSAPTNATSQPKALSTGGTAGILLGMNTFTASDQGADWAFRFAAAPTSASGGVFAFRTQDNTTLVPFFNYTEGVQYSLKIVADYSTGKLDAYVNNNLQLSNYAFWTSGKTNVVTDEYFFHLNGELGNANSVALDNIASVSAVPEAGAFLFGGLACAVTAAGALGRKMVRRMEA
jgi:hypothetical protein